MQGLEIGSLVKREAACEKKRKEKTKIDCVRKGSTRSVLPGRKESPDMVVSEVPFLVITVGINLVKNVPEPFSSLQTVQPFRGLLVAFVVVIVVVVVLGIPTGP